MIAADILLVNAEMLVKPNTNKYAITLPKVNTIPTQKRNDPNLLIIVAPFICNVPLG